MFRAPATNRGLLARALVTVLRTPEPVAPSPAFDYTYVGMDHAPSAPVPSVSDRSTEKQDIVDQLIAYVLDEPTPASEAVWALSQAHTQRAVEAFAHVLREWLADSTLDDEAAYQAVVGAADVPEPPVDVLRYVALQGRERPREFAEQWLCFSTLAHAE